MYIPNKTDPKNGEWVITKKVHKSCAGTFTKGTKVKVTEINQMRGYSIEDEFGNRMIEIGWEI